MIGGTKPLHTKNVFTFIIPCYGSERTIIPVLNEIETVMAMKNDIRPLKAQKFYNVAYEVICVNDASPDAVLSVLRDEVDSGSRPYLTIIDLAKNMGKQSAVMAGFAYAQGDFIVNLDDDGQCPVNRLWDLVSALEIENADVVMGAYSVRRQSAFKNFGSKLNTKMAEILAGKPKNIKLSNLYVSRRFVIDEVLQYKNPYPYIGGLLLRVTNNIVNVPVENRERFDGGRGNFTFRKSLSLWLNGFTAFSVKPLRIATVLGMLLAIVGFILVAIIVIRKLIEPSIPMGWSSTMAMLLFIGGSIMIMLGLIGEYLGRAYISLNNSPQYVVREVIKND
jgi:undecaprenyl-phosphate 4-deoxy-4-formamido-L-arabinose transferase